MQLNDLGNYVKQCWENIPMFFPQVRIDEFVIMPNHLHGIIEIIEQVKGKCNLPLQSRAAQKGTSQTIGSIVRGFKAGVTSWARKNSEIFDVWQRNYYEHIIRDEKSYLQIYEYIQNNPILWEQDQLCVIKRAITSLLQFIYIIDKHVGANYISPHHKQRFSIQIYEYISK